MDYADDNFGLYNITDTTKSMYFDLSSLPTTQRVKLTLPVVTAESKIAVDNVDNAFSVTQTFSGAGLEFYNGVDARGAWVTGPTHTGSALLLYGGTSLPAELYLGNDAVGGTSVYSNATAPEIAYLPGETGTLVTKENPTTISGEYTFDGDAGGFAILQSLTPASVPLLVIRDVTTGFGLNVLTSTSIGADADLTVPGSGGALLSTTSTATVTNKTITTLKNSTTSQGIPVVAGNGADPPAASALGKVAKTAQAAAIASTNLTNTNPAGMYVIDYYATTTTANVTDGTITLTLTYVDRVGSTTQTATGTLSLAATSTGTTALKGSIVIYKASGEISYATAVTGAQTTSRYSLDMRVNFKG